MQYLRWKGAYLTGHTAVDERKRSLYEILNGLRLGLAEVEHCQDIVELLGALNAEAGTLLAHKPAAATQPCPALAAHQEQLRHYVENGLPLAARGTPSCHECGLCDRLEQQMTAWLDECEESVGQRRHG